MCRSHRRCKKTEATKAREREAAKRYYRRTKARATISGLREAGISAMDDMDCPVTYHGAPTPPDLSRPPGAEPGARKPPGLWTSPGRTDHEGAVRTAWMDWCVSEDFGEPNSGSLYAIRPTPGATIIRLDDEKDITGFANRFPGVGSSDPTIREQEWQNIRHEGVDGVMLTASGVRTAKDITFGPAPRPVAKQVRDTATSLEAWDMSSMVWLRTDRLEMEEAPMGLYPPHQPTEEEKNLGPDFMWFVPSHDLEPGHEGQEYEEGRATTR